MKCKKCGSENVNVQAIGIVKNKHHGIFYWCIGWIIDLIIWLFAFIPRLIIAIFRPKKVKTKVKSYAVCQECGYKWKV